MAISVKDLREALVGLPDEMFVMIDEGSMTPSRVIEKPQVETLRFFDDGSVSMIDAYVIEEYDCKDYECFVLSMDIE